MSLAINIPSIAKEAPVPIPGTNDAAPDATSPNAPVKSPFIALLRPKPIPAIAPTTGIFLSNDLPKLLPPVLVKVLAIFLPPTFFAVFATVLATGPV